MEVNDYIQNNGQAFINNFLIPFLKIKSISPDKAFLKEMDEAVDFLSAKLETLGFTVTKQPIREANKAVFAEKIIDPSKPTVLFYGHYDVQPINEPDKWVLDGEKINPFNPVIKGDRIYGRGTTDDKGQVASMVLALEYLHAQGEFPCNIKLLIEGNEECSAAGFEEFVEQNGELLKCDSVIISDSSTMVEGEPTLLGSLKGIVVTEVAHDDPKKLLAIVHAAHDAKRNKVLVPKFYEAVRDTPIDPEAEKIAGEPEPQMGTILKPEEGFSQLHHRWLRPTFTPLHVCYKASQPTNGKTYKITTFGPTQSLHSGSYGGPVQEPGLLLIHLLGQLQQEGVDFAIDYLKYGSKAISTTIKPSGEAQIVLENAESLIHKAAEEQDIDPSLFKIEEVTDNAAYLNDDGFHKDEPRVYLSNRLVADQVPKEITEAICSFMQEKGATAREYQAPASSLGVRTEDKYIQAVIEALKKGYGKDKVLIACEGGSIPISALLHEVTGAEVAFAGFSTPTDGLHGPNESYRIEGGLYVGAKCLVHALRNTGNI